ncbi:MAG: flagellar hook-basal body complex protein FliE [Phycisphaerales bacterium JB059]
MSDPLGLVGSGSGVPQPPIRPNAKPQQGAGAPDFKSVLIDNLQQVNELEQDATRAVEDLLTGKRDDLEGVILATEKADSAFRMLQSMRNKVMQAYDEIKQIRV